MTFDLNGPIRDYEERMIYVFGGRVDHNNNMVHNIILVFPGFLQNYYATKDSFGFPNNGKRPKSTNIFHSLEFC